jgi:hypothetical protein
MCLPIVLYLVFTLRGVGVGVGGGGGNAVIMGQANWPMPFSLPSLEARIIQSEDE